ncbi:chromate transporter [Psychrosphaera saromensis]|nr:chromate transporter [Psychrosphaera saromensis]GLQ13114.1 chromate transporter [Psychrosphaera saromensis]
MLETSVNSNSKTSVFSVFKTFLKLGLTSFGGPVAHLSYFRKELVERQKWVNENQYSQLLAICQFLPGPASSQVGFALGLLRAGWFGAISAFIGFTLPSVILLIAFASILPYLSGEMGIAAIHGLKLVTCAVVADAVWGMFNKLCPDITRRLLTLAVMCMLLFVDSTWSQMFAVFVGALMGIWLCKQPEVETENTINVHYSKKFGLMLFTIFTVLLLMFMLVGGHDGLFTIAQIFYNAGALVFGGGHVVLPLLQDSVVGTGLVGNEQFIAGYGASQAIPGPMFAFAAYLGALIPVEQGPFLGVFVALIFIFLPGFLLVGAALPLWQAVSHRRTAANAIAGVNAAVVGILAAVFYDPILTSAISSLFDVAVAGIGFIMLMYFKRSPLLVVFWCIAMSMLSSYFY